MSVSISMIMSISIFFWSPHSNHARSLGVDRWGDPPNPPRGRGHAGGPPYQAAGTMRWGTSETTFTADQKTLHPHPHRPKVVSRSMPNRNRTTNPEGRRRREGRRKEGERRRAGAAPAGPPCPRVTNANWRSRPPASHTRSRSGTDVLGRPTIHRRRDLVSSIRCRHAPGAI